MSADHGGGPAFPCHGSMGEVAHEGMSLRDYFAAKAMQALIPDCEIMAAINVRKDFIPLTEGQAEAAYAFADAMLEARK